MEYINKKLEDFNEYIKNKKIAIIGLGVSNIPLLDYLHDKTDKITVFDNKISSKISKTVMQKIEKYDIVSFFGKKALSNLKGFDIIFRSPSCLPSTPELVEEAKKGALVTSEVEMLLKLTPCPVIGVTGSDGKTTTTSLIYNILKQGGYNCYLGGNIGIPLFTKISGMTPKDIIVIELSSFQLMNMETSPNISVITNICPNHLDIHSSYDEYVEAKKNIFLHQTRKDILVLNFDNILTKTFAKKAKGSVEYFSSKEKVSNGVIYDLGIIKECNNKIRKHLLNTSQITLKGIHNYENICAAISATRSLVSAENIITAVKKFKGVEHRIELVKTIKGVKWYNDSIASSPTRTIAALNSFNENIILIAGGYDKNLDYSEVAKYIVNKVKNLILIGSTASKISAAVNIELINQKKELSIDFCKSLEESIDLAKNYSKKGDVVILSPASASFDMFKNYEERGNKFKELVKNI